MPDMVKITCLRCGATNNYPLSAGGKKVVCGRCKNSLPIPGVVLEPTAEELQTLLQDGRLPVLIDFFSPTCGPCHMMHPIVQRLAERRKGELMAVRVNVDAQHQAASSFAIQAVPTFVVYALGYERGRTSGAMPETDFSLWVAGKA